MRDNALAGADLFRADAARPDTYLCVLPLFHSFGQSVVQNGALAFGGTVVMLPRFEAGAALALMQRERVTFFAGVPTMYWALLGALDAAGDGSAVDVRLIAGNLRLAAAGGSALPVEVHPGRGGAVAADDGDRQDPQARPRLRAAVSAQVGPVPADRTGEPAGGRRPGRPLGR
jgi:hypothetical protein